MTVCFFIPNAVSHNLHVLPGWRSPIYPEASVSSPDDPYDLLEGVQREPVSLSISPSPQQRDLTKLPPPQLCHYYPPTNTNHPGKLMSLSDPRWPFVLHMNWRAQTLPFLLHGPSSSSPSTPAPQPTQSQIRSISPFAQIRSGAYRTPTFLIHGRPDDLIPWQQSARTIEALRDSGVEAGIEVVEGARHLFDTFPEIGVDFEPAVERGYRWLGQRV